MLFTAIHIYSQKNVTLIFRNGDSLKVISNLTSGTTKIKYKLNEDSKKNTVDSRKVKKAVEHHKSENIIYTFKIKLGHTIPVLLKQVAAGKMYLYKLDFTREVNNRSFFLSEYYVCKNDNDVVTTFNANGIFIENGFRKKSREVFKDCPSLLKKINNKVWKMKDIPKIVNFYNQNCGMIEK